MAGQVEIVNRALVALGDERIVAMTDDAKRARVMSDIYATSRDLLLGEHRWGFSMRRSRLPADIAAPAWGFARSFTLPSDFLLFDRVAGAYIWGGRAPDGLWQREGGAILTNLAAPLDVRYVAQITDPGAWPPVFVAAFALQLAYDAAPSLGRSNASDLDRLARDLDRAIKRASLLSAIENPPEETPEDPWLLARRT